MREEFWIAGPGYLVVYVVSFLALRLAQSVCQRRPEGFPNQSVAFIFRSIGFGVSVVNIRRENDTSFWGIFSRPQSQL